MTTQIAIAEFRAVWLPNVSDSGLNRLTSMLEAGSPYLIHGTFSRSVPQGCLASHIAWNHPRTAHLGDEAGICWLAKVARLNPATSRLVIAWDRGGVGDYELRFALLDACYLEAAHRRGEWADEPAEQLLALV